jgi:hypothetical protein
MKTRKLVALVVVVLRRLLPHGKKLARQVFALLMGLFAVTASGNVPEPPGSTPPLLDCWSFSDTNYWKSDLRFAPISFTNLSASLLGDGTAVVIDSTNAAWLRYNTTETNGTNELLVGLGTLVFWFAPSWSGTNEGGSGVPGGQWGRLIEAGQYTTNASVGWWSLYLDPAGANIYFGAQSNNGSSAVYLSAPISWTTNRWHQIALTYSTTNIALYLDGTLAKSTNGLTIWPGPNVLTNGFWIGSDSNGVAQAHGMFDDLATYNVVLDSAAISNAFERFYTYYYMNPMNWANLSSAPSSPSTNGGLAAFDAITGPGYLTLLGTNSTGCVTASNIWFTNVSASITSTTNASITFTIAGGSNNVLYDVSGTTNLEYPITNAVWAWLGQGYHCSTYTITNLPLQSVFLILGTPQDTDLDGLTDAYERLVSHTNPTIADTSGDGMLDGWKVLWGLNPLINNPAQSGQRANYQYDPVGRVDLLSGVRSETISNDFEGNILQNY